MKRTTFIRIAVIGVLKAALLTPSLFGQSPLTYDNRRVDVDTTLCGTTKCRSARVTNPTAVPLTISEIDGVSAPFSINPTTAAALPLTIAAGASVDLSFCYAPTVAPSNDALFAIVSVDTGGAEPARDTLTLAGQATTPFATFNTPALAFGNVNVGQQLCLPVTITNAGQAPLVISGMSGLAAPFSAQDPTATPIAPGASRTIDICFTPLFTGPRSDTLVLITNGCLPAARLVVSGTGLQPTPGIGPVLQIDPVLTDFDTTRCGTEKCRTIALRNVGTAPLNVTSAEQLPLPFRGSISPLPFTLQPNQSRLFEVCYTPSSPIVRDSATIGLVADNRVSLTIAMTFDVSGSMQTAIGSSPAVPKIDAANAGGRSFIAQLVNSPALGIVDTVAVYQFAATSDFRRLAGYTVDRGALSSAVPTTANGAATCIYDAVIRSITELRNRNLPGRRVLVILTDGQNNCQPSLDDAIAFARQNGVKVFTIGVGNPSDVNVADLTRLAQQTGGTFQLAQNGQQVVQVYAQIAASLSRDIPTTLHLQGRSVAPRLTVVTPEVDLDSARIGTTVCGTITLRNDGDAPLELTTSSVTDPQFAITSGLPAVVAPGATRSLGVCFAPNRIRQQSATASIPWTSCAPTSSTVALRAVGYDSVVVALVDSVVGRPGSAVEIPVRLRDAIPFDYDVRDLVLTVAYNKTMLHPLDTFAIVEGTAVAGMAQSGLNRGFEGPLARTTVTLAGAPLVGDSGETLVRLRFLVLHGNAMLTPVTLVALRFADGNPKSGLVTPGAFAADSLCYQRERLIDASARFGASFKAVRGLGNGTSATAILNVPLDERCRIDLYDGLGRYIRTIDDRDFAAGDHELAIDLGGLSAGAYHLRVISNGSSDASIITINR